MRQKCPLCGADFPPGDSCQHRFDLCLALEFENPDAFGAVHHLTVPCYMLQHNAYSRDVWLEARRMISRFLRDGVTPAEIRSQNRTRYAGERRTWSVTRGEKLAEFDTTVWTRTIADVRLDAPDIYCADVRLWAASILDDTEKLSGEEARR